MLITLRCAPPAGRVAATPPASLTANIAAQIELITPIANNAGVVLRVWCVLGRHHPAHNAARLPERIDQRDAAWRPSTLLGGKAQNAGTDATTPPPACSGDGDRFTVGGTCKRALLEDGNEKLQRNEVESRLSQGRAKVEPRLGQGRVKLEPSRQILSSMRELSIVGRKMPDVTPALCQTSFLPRLVPAAAKRTV
jgi:hypothetical protein